MPSIISRPPTTIVSPLLSLKSKCDKESKLQTNRLTRGCTGWKTTGTLKKSKVMLEKNDCYNIIMNGISELTIKHMMIPTVLYLYEIFMLYQNNCCAKNVLLQELNKRGRILMQSL